jgi:hypothetical protein
MTLFFCTLLFSGPYFGPYFFSVTNQPMFSKQEYWVQIDWAIASITESRHLEFIVDTDEEG